MSWDTPTRFHVQRKGFDYRPAAVRAALIPSNPGFFEVLPVNMSRWSIMWPAPRGQVLQFRPMGFVTDPSIAVVQDQAFNLNQSAGWFYLDAEMIGDLITQAWEASISLAPFTLMTIETMRY